MSEYRRINDEVFYTAQPLAVIGGEDLARLRTLAECTPRRRSRVCLHDDPSASVHEMVIVHPRGTYVRPHRHLDRAETFIVLEGQCRLVLLNEVGAVERTITLAAPGGTAPFLAHLPVRHFHSLLIDCEWLSFLEVTQGPFNSQATEFAPWAPDGSDAAAADQYIQTLAGQARSDD